jgi:hypothetical protein
LCVVANGFVDNKTTRAAPAFSFQRRHLGLLSVVDALIISKYEE